ncbi:MAG: HAD family hydrolase [Halothece sp.]
MYLTPICQAFGLEKIRLIATDMDGTLTQEGKFTVSMFQCLEALAEAGFYVIIVTGRSAGWVNGLNTYLPVTGAIAENGGLYYSSKIETPEILSSIPNLNQHRQQLLETFQFLQQFYPQLQESTDNAFRLTDWTFDVKGLTPQQLQHLNILCQEKGWSFTYSTVQCHIKPRQQDKAASLQKVINSYFPKITSKEILTVGDSPNDESLFNASLFPHSVGVANIQHYTSQLKHCPVYVTPSAEGKGFQELTQYLLSYR